MKAREVNRRIERPGGQMMRQVGSHRRYAAMYLDAKGNEAQLATTVPQRQGDIPVGTLRAELDGIGIHQLISDSDGDDAVTTARFTWNGHDLLPEDTALFRT